MGFLDRLFGPKSSPQARSPVHDTAANDVRAIERYRYLLRTAPPDAIEQAHAEAFAQLTPEQRTHVLRSLTETLPVTEQPVTVQAEPHALARMATRAELRQPGTMERLFGGRPGAMGMTGMGGLGMGGMFAGTLLSSIAGAFIGSAIANQFLGGFDAGGASPDPEPTEADPTESTDPADADLGSEDFSDGDFDI